MSQDNGGRINNAKGLTPFVHKVVVPQPFSKADACAIYDAEGIRTCLADIVLQSTDRSDRGDVRLMYTHADTFSSQRICESVKTGRSYIDQRYITACIGHKFGSLATDTSGCTGYDYPLPNQAYHSYLRSSG